MYENCLESIDVSTLCPKVDIFGEKVLSVFFLVKIFLGNILESRILFHVDFQFV